MDENNKDIIPQYLKDKYESAALLDKGDRQVREAVRSTYMANPQISVDTNRKLINEEIRQYLESKKPQKPTKVDVDRVSGYSTLDGLPVFRHCGS